MKIKLVDTRNLITKSSIPTIDFVINPYIGCQHGCIYCYAEFMKRFTNHGGENWGEFLDVKQVQLDKIKPEKYDTKTILISSVTDPYIPLEMKYKNTRKILAKLVGTTAQILILTKSRLVVRDIDLFIQFENIHVGISINTLDANFAKEIEPLASKPFDRIKALQEIKQNNITTYVFISPIFPKITDYQAIIEQSRDFTNYYRFENLNFRSHNIPRIFKLIKQKYPKFLGYYKKIKDDFSIWDIIQDEIERYCNQQVLEFKIDFHHGGFSKRNNR